MSRMRLVPLIVAIAFFMEGLDGTVITTALPAMALDMHTSAVVLSSGISAYLVSLAVFIPLGGWIADRRGESTAFSAALLIFTAASIACAVATSPALFVAARVAQGLGGAMMVPVGRLIILRTFEKAQFVQAMSMVTTPALVGPLVGPLLGGFLTTYFSWRWIFAINVPIGIAGAILALLWIRTTKPAVTARFDALGFVLTALAVGCCMSGLDLLTRNDVSHALVLGLFVAGVFTGIAAVVHARTAREPLLDLALFRITTFRTPNTWGNVYRACVMATPFLLPLLFQIGFGMSAFASGLLTFISAFGAMTMKRAAPTILKRFGFRHVLALNGTLCGLAILLFAFTDAWAIALIIAAVLGFGFTRSLQLASMNALQFSNVTTAQHGPAASLSSMLQQVASGAGIALAAVSLHVLTGHHTTLPAILDRADIRTTFLLVAVTTIVSSLFFLRLDERAGAEFSGHRDATAPVPAPTA